MCHLAGRDTFLLYAIRDDAIRIDRATGHVPTTQHSPASPQAGRFYTAPDMIVFQYIERCKSNGICTVEYRNPYG